MSDNRPTRFYPDPVSAAKLSKKFGTKLKPPRQHLCYVVEIVNHRIDLKYETITSTQAEEAIKTMGLLSRFTINPQALDDSGLCRTLGDLIGGHGLRLPTLGKRASAGNIYQLPSAYIDDDYLRDIGIDPELVYFQRVHDDLMHAVEHRLVVSFYYDTDPIEKVRILHPHFYGTQSGEINVEGYQESGYSKSGQVPTWRNFHRDNMKNITVLQVHFEPQPHFDDNSHKKYSEPFAVIKRKGSL